MSDPKDVPVFDEAQLKAALEDNRNKIDQMLRKAGEEAASARSISQETKNAIEKLTEEAQSIDQRLVALEQRGHGDEPTERKSIAQQVVESEPFQAMIQGRAKFASHEIKTTLTNATINTSQPLVPVDHMTTPYTLPERQLSIWDIVPKGRTASNLIAWPRENAWTDNTGPQVSGSPLAYTEGATKPYLRAA